MTQSDPHFPLFLYFYSSISISDSLYLVDFLPISFRSSPHFSAFTPLPPHIYRNIRNPFGLFAHVSDLSSDHYAYHIHSGTIPPKSISISNHSIFDHIPIIASSHSSEIHMDIHIPNGALPHDSRHSRPSLAYLGDCLTPPIGSSITLLYRPNVA